MKYFNRCDVTVLNYRQFCNPSYQSQKLLLHLNGQSQVADILTHHFLHWGPWWNRVLKYQMSPIFFLLRTSYELPKFLQLYHISTASKIQNKPKKNFHGCHLYIYWSHGIKHLQQYGFLFFFVPPQLSSPQSPYHDPT